MRRSNRSQSSGQVLPLFVVVLLFAALVGVGLVHVAGASAQRASAQAAADAAALAGADGGADAAAETAGANGASMVRYATDDLDVVVTVVRRGYTATARARWRPTYEDPPNN